MITPTRRQMLGSVACGMAGFGMSSWSPAIAGALAAEKNAGRRCVLLWMPGGPSQTDTFDMKPGHENGGEFKERPTSVPGVRFSEHLPKLAARAKDLAIIRSLSTAEGDHARGTYLMHTGQRPGGPVNYPTIGSALAKQLSEGDSELPDFVSIAPYTAFSPAAYGPGFLGPTYAPLFVGGITNFGRPVTQPGQTYADLRVDDLQNPDVNAARSSARLGLWQGLQSDFIREHSAQSPIAHDVVYRRAVQLMQSDAAKAFDLSEEPSKVRDAYGQGRFGQGCLMARRLLEQGVRFVEVALSGSAQGVLGWDTHTQNFQRVKDLSTELDAGWSTLMSELDERGLLESTTIIWLGEFGRTPKIVRAGGRDHFPAAWSGVLAGGGVNGGQVHGRTSNDGMEVEEGKVDVSDVFATLCKALKVDPRTQNESEDGRPIRISEGKPIDAILA